MSEIHEGDVVGAGCCLIIIVIWLAFWISVICTAVHFIRKFW